MLILSNDQSIFYPNSGKLGFIVPVSLISTDRMRSIREFIHNKSS